jgi:DNA-binding PadR family transcriptional regulator
MSTSSDLVRGTIVPVVLKLLSEREMYGYEIVKEVNRRSGGVLEWKEGTLYPALHKLQVARLVSASWQEAPTGEAGSRKRKYYHITAKGKRELAKRAGEWKEFSAAVSMLVLGV